jgi:hypothetical protein
VTEDEVDLALFVEPAQHAGIAFIPIAEDELHFPRASHSPLDEASQ